MTWLAVRLHQQTRIFFAWLFSANSNHVIAVGTVIAAGAAIAYAIIASRTLNTMDRQLDAMRATITQNRESVRQAIAQTKAAQKSAEAAESAARTAATTLKSASQSLIVENRPYVVVEEVGFLDIPRVGLKMRARVKFKNTGKTTALDVSAIGVIAIAPSEDFAVQRLNSSRTSNKDKSTIELGPGLSVLMEFVRPVGYTIEQLEAPVPRV
jgi:hypothetical protein